MQIGQYTGEKMFSCESVAPLPPEWVSNVDFRDGCPIQYWFSLWNCVIHWTVHRCVLHTSVPLRWKTIVTRWCFETFQCLVCTDYCHVHGRSLMFLIVQLLDGHTPWLIYFSTRDIKPHTISRRHGALLNLTLQCCQDWWCDNRNAADYLSIKMQIVKFNKATQRKASLMFIYQISNSTAKLHTH